MTTPVYTFKGKYDTYQVYLHFDKYRSNGRTCIELLEVGTNEPVLVATVNIENYCLLKPDEVIIKNYSENEGVLEFLIQNGIVSKPRAWVATGWVTVALCGLLKTR